jgi:hypothetical protein
VTTSGTTTFELTTTQIIARAFKRLGIAQEGEALTALMYEDGRDELNLLINEWNAAEHLWIQEEGTVALVASQPSYVVSPRALRIWNCRYRQSGGTDVPMTKFSRQEYLDQPNKTTSPSIPVNYYFDPKVSTGTLYLWPAPSAQTIASGLTIHYDYFRFMSIQVASNDTLDMPQQWQQALIWNLANNLETQYPVNDPKLADKIERRAGQTFAAISGWDNEDASIFISPDYRWDNRA